MIFVLLLLVFLLIFSTRIVRDGNEGYISRAQTQTINGVFIILVFLRHFNQYVELNSVLDVPFLYMNAALGQLIVTTFMFYSGYGILYSIQHKGKGYIKGMPKNRILNTMILFDGAILLYVMMNLVLGIEMTVLQVILSLIGWSGVGNSTWYIFAILCMYLLTYVSFSIAEKFGKRDIFAVILATVLIFGYVLVVRRFKDSQYYNTVLCYALGLWYACFQDKIERVLKGRGGYPCALVLCVLAFGVSAWLRDVNLLVNQAYYLLFVLVIVLLSMKLKVNSNVFQWCGENLLGLYILQRIPMIALQQSGWMLQHTYVYFLLCALITVGLTVAYRCLYINRIESLLKS